MASMEALTSFFGWLTLVNIAVYMLTVLGIVTMRGFMLSMNTRLFGISEEEVSNKTFDYVARFKLYITVFAFAPWAALKLMA